DGAMNRTGWLEEVRSQLAETAAVQQLVAEHCGAAILAAAALIADSLARGGAAAPAGRRPGGQEPQRAPTERVAGGGGGGPPGREHRGAYRGERQPAGRGRGDRPRRVQSEAGAHT